MTNTISVNNVINKLNFNRTSEIIYITKGILIILVVAGHYYFPEYNPDYWLRIRSFIYLYHMPSFMMISGVLFALHPSTIKSLSSYAKFVTKKFRRLMIPYFTVGIIVATFKYILSYYFKIGHQVDDKFLYYFIFNPMANFSSGGGFAQFLWFLYALFTIFCIYPILKFAFKHDLVILILSLAFVTVKFPPYFCLDHAIRFLPYFIAGIIVGSNFDSIIFANYYKILLFVGFMMISALQYSNLIQNIYIDIVAAVISGIVILNISDFLFSKANILASIGFYSSGIYLFHLIFIAPLVILFHEVLHFDKTYFVIVFPSIIFIGILLPILFTKYFGYKNSYASQYLLGVFPKKVESFSP